MSETPVACPFCRPELGNMMKPETLDGYTFYVCGGCDAESPMHENPVAAYEIAMRPSRQLAARQLAALREENELLRKALGDIRGIHSLASRHKTDFAHRIIDEVLSATSGESE